MAAGIDGVINKLDRPPQGDTKASTLPTTLSEALQCLQTDELMVELLGREFVDWFVRIKTEAEVEKLGDIDIKKGKNLEREKQMYFTYL